MTAKGTEISPTELRTDLADGPAGLAAATSALGSNLLVAAMCRNGRSQLRALDPTCSMRMPSRAECRHRGMHFVKLCFRTIS